MKNKKMERYIKIKAYYYYDCWLNKILNSAKPLSQHISSNGCSFVPMYNNDTLQNNLRTNRQQLILSVTEECNFRCEYCAYYDSRYDNTVELKKMPFDIAKMAIDDFISNSNQSEKRCISFYGGEPLLNFGVIKQCVEYVESLNINKQMVFLITTNGTLLNEEIARFLYEKRFIVNISLDGPYNIHNRYRKEINNRDTFAKIIRSAKKLIELDPVYWEKSLNIFSVLAPPVDLKAILDFFEVMPYNYTLSDLIMTNHMQKCLEQNNCLDPENYYIEEPINLRNYSRQIGIIEDEVRLMNKILQRSMFIKNIAPGSYCFPIVRRTFISSTGNYYICEKYDQDIANSFGNVESGLDYNKLFNLQAKVLNFHNTNCKQCWAVRFCGICFATMDRYPDCCEEYKKSAMRILRDLVGVNYGK